MNKTLTKTLLCGVLATTFFIVNCQKAPSRGVKAKQVTPAAGTAPVNKLANLKVAECTPEYIKSSNDLLALQEKMKPLLEKAITNKATLSESEQAELKNLRADYIEKQKITLADIDKMKAGDAPAEACKKDKIEVIFEQQKNVINTLITKAGEVLKIKDPAQAEAEQKLAENKKTAASKELAQGTEFFITSELASVLKATNTGVILFKAGKIFKDDSGESAKIKKEYSSQTICELGAGTTAETELTEKNKLKVIDVNLQTKANVPAQLSVSLVDDTTGEEGNQIYIINCYLAKGKEKSFATEFRIAFDKHLKTELEKPAAAAPATGGKKDETPTKPDPTKTDPKPEKPAAPAASAADFRKTEKITDEAAQTETQKAAYSNYVNADTAYNTAVKGKIELEAQIEKLKEENIQILLSKDKEKDAAKKSALTNSINENNKKIQALAAQHKTASQTVTDSVKARNQALKLLEESKKN